MFNWALQFLEIISKLVFVHPQFPFFDMVTNFIIILSFRVYYLEFFCFCFSNRQQNNNKVERKTTIYLHSTQRFQKSQKNCVKAAKT